MRFPACLTPLTFLWSWLILCALAASSAERAAAPIDLLPSQADNGQLPGWTAYHEEPEASVGEVWTLEDGLLSCRGTPRGYICTEREFGNFVLELDWRLPAEKGPLKGGVLIRMTGPDRIWPKSLEAQINSGEAGDFWGLAGYRLSGPTERFSSTTHPDFGKLVNLKRIVDAEKPRGQWNHYRIVADGATVTLEINGKMVNRATGCSATPGKICLTSEGNAIQFRNVKLTPLGE